MNMEDKIKTINPWMSQVILRKLGAYASSYLGNDIYYFVEAINLLVADLGEKFLIEEYKKNGKDWLVTEKRLQEITALATKVKIFYDPIQDKKFERKGENVNKIQAHFKNYFLRVASKFPIIQRELYDLFIFLINKTNLKNQVIPADAFKILEHQGMRKMDLIKKPIHNIDDANRT